jgi:predicted component of type VI protein secretion system
MGTRDLPKDAPPGRPGTQALTGQIEEGPSADVNAAISSVGSEEFHDQWLIRIEIENSTEPTLLRPTHEIIIGRKDPATGSMPDIDLTPFAGYRMGVSRRHAAIRLTEGHFLDLWDLGSSNGTFLNGMRLVAYRPHRLRDGDEIRLGQLSMHAFFQPPQLTKAADSPKVSD